MPSSAASERVDQCGVLRCRLEGSGDHRLDLVVGHRPWTTRARLVEQTLQPLVDEPGPPPPRGRDADVEFPGDRADNASTHKTPAIKRWLTQHPRFVLHFTPTSSSWLNLVERWFGELTTKKLRRGTHRSVRALNADIRSWITNWNNDPKPYIWTKTADEILESIARYCTRINDSRH